MKIVYETWLEDLKEAYGASSRNNNLFEKLVKSIKWDEVYKTLDETTVFVKCDFQIEVNSLDVFDAFRPNVMIGDEIIHF